MTEWPNGGMAAHTAEKKILKDGSNTIKHFILGENGGQSTKIYNLIYSFKLVYICMLFKVMQVCKPSCHFQGDLLLKWKLVDCLIHVKML